MKDLEGISQETLDAFGVCEHENLIKIIGTNVYKEKGGPWKTEGHPAMVGKMEDREELWLVNTPLDAMRLYQEGKRSVVSFVYDDNPENIFRYFFEMLPHKKLVIHLGLSYEQMERSKILFMEGIKYFENVKVKFQGEILNEEEFAGLVRKPAVNRSHNSFVIKSF